MPTHTPRGEHRPALFSLPEAAPATVLRAGELLKDAGRPLAALEIYEAFIAGLQQHAMQPIQDAAPATATARGRDRVRYFDDLLLVRAHPERYTFT